SEDESDGEEDLGLNIGEEERHDEEEEEDEFYRDVNINQGRGLQGTLELEDTHVTLTPVKPDGQQESSSVSSQFVTSMLNPKVDMNEAVQVAVQLQSDRLCEEAQKENDKFLRTVDENIKKIIKEQVKEQVKAQVSKILPRIEQAVNEQLEAEFLTKSSHSSRTSYAVAADLSEMELKKILIKKMEGNKEDVMMIKTRMKNPPLDQNGGQRDAEKHPEWFSQPKKPPSPNRDWNKTLPAVHRSTQPWISELEKQADTRSSFNELMDTPLDFSNFIMNRLRFDTLTPELLAGPTYDLVKGSLLMMYIPREESFLSRNSRLWNGIATRIWIGLQYDYLPQTIWRRSDKDRAAAMI
nr:hypothetical protein [Tanacetum cinerariifolium]